MFYGKRKNIYSIIDWFQYKVYDACSTTATGNYFLIVYHTIFSFKEKKLTQHLQKIYTTFIFLNSKASKI